MWYANSITATAPLKQKITIIKVLYYVYLFSLLLFLSTKDATDFLISSNSKPQLERSIFLIPLSVMETQRNSFCFIGVKTFSSFSSCSSFTLSKCWPVDQSSRAHFPPRLLTQNRDWRLKFLFPQSPSILLILRLYFKLKRILTKRKVLTSNILLLWWSFSVYLVV